MNRHLNDSPALQDTSRSYKTAIVASVLFGFFGGGEWYLGNRRLAILMLILLPFGAPGFWFGLLRAVLLGLAGPESFERRFGWAGEGQARMAPSRGAGPQLGVDRRWTADAANVHHPTAGMMDAGMTAWQREDAPREALIAGRLSIDAYLEHEKREQQR